MSTADWWPTDYFNSRQRFVELANACGALIDSHAIQATGSANEPLFVDVASLSSPGDEHLIVIVSGLHGVEGFIGASVQVQLLSRLEKQGRPDGIGVLMIHAANPWGFAHLRRVNEDNIDLNRNFLTASSTRSKTHTRYAALDPIINPREAPGLVGDIQFWLSACRLIVQDRGIRKLFKPIAEGQYDFPQGLFYGGGEKSQSCQLIEEIVSHHAEGVAEISVLDVHSGLGPSGTATLIASSNRFAREKGQSYLEGHFEQSVHMEGQPDNAYHANNTFSQWCQAHLDDKHFLYLCIEIGTVNPLKLFSALRRENQARHWGRVESTVSEQTRHALLKVFSPSSADWRSKSTRQALRVFDKTLELTGELK